MKLKQFVQPALAILFGSISCLSLASCSGGGGGGDNSPSAWDIVINNPTNGFIMKAVYPSDNVMETYTCRPDGTCDIEFSDGPGKTAGLPYTLTKIDDTHAVFIDSQEMKGAKAEDVFEITYNPSTRQSKAKWTETYTPETGSPQKDTEDNIAITFELLP